jgi:hypothetical protein
MTIGPSSTANRVGCGRVPRSLLGKFEVGQWQVFRDQSYNVERSVQTPKSGDNDNNKINPLPLWNGVGHIEGVIDESEDLGVRRTMP